MNNLMNKVRKNKKGFTLMEMLIVVAIIAILVAVAIPTFSSALAKAKAGTDVANIRSGYAAATIEALTGGGAGTYCLNQDGTVTKGTATDTYNCKGASEHADSDASIGGKIDVSVAKSNTKGTTTAGVSWLSGAKIAFTVAADANGVLSVTEIVPSAA